ncbi:hypothetical protein BDW02DRAFT_631801 [Decorospora gaudefroyi]|uniref:Uncharacterized protein n=1 Tax=Decorospora gaudefroyi TaxID=184978 RepID=A0A6A5K9T1_9PLEO|nr:hypothetical protein BDW02DRAFT_631801 [Decorospora gaudefroyi]
MWFKAWPALFGLQAWFTPPLPASNVSAVLITDYVCNVPPQVVLPTVTVTETVGVVATAITHVLPSVSTLEHSAVPCPTLSAYKYSTPYSVTARSPLQKRMTLIEWLLETQFSAIGVLVGFAMLVTLLSLPCFVIACFSNDINYLFGIFQVVAEAVVSDLTAVGNCIGFAGYLIGYVGLLVGYIGGLAGYFEWQTVLNCILACILCLTLCCTWPVLKRGASRCYRWAGRQVAAWYHSRSNRHRIDPILEKPWTRYTIAECLFPDSAELPLNPSFSVLVVAFAADCFYLFENGVTLAYNVYVRRLKRVPGKLHDIRKIIVKVLLDDDDFSWKLFLTCFEVVFAWFVNAISKGCIWVKEIFNMFRGMVYMGGKVFEAIFHNYVRSMAKEIPAHIRQQPKASITGEIWNAYEATSNMCWTERVDMFMRLKVLEEANAQLKQDNAGLQASHPESKVKELAKKTTGYRLSLCEAINLCNYYRMLLCSILNANHNICNGRKPNALKAENPYTTRSLEFIADPDPRTGMFFRLIPSSTKAFDYSAGFVTELRQYFWNENKECNATPSIMTGKYSGPAHVPNSFDPFSDDEWIFMGNFPGMQIPFYSPHKNPYNISHHQVEDFRDPAVKFGPQIEDFAAAGHLELWGKTDATAQKKKKQVMTFTKSEIQNFIRDIEFSTAPIRKSDNKNYKIMPATTPGNYCRDPWPSRELTICAPPPPRYNFA